MLARHLSQESGGAQATGHAALALAEEFGMRPLQDHCHLSLGTLYGKIGQREQARSALSMAIEMCRAMEMTYWLSEAEAVLAQVIASESPASGSS